MEVLIQQLQEGLGRPHLCQTPRRCHCNIQATGFESQDSGTYHVGGGLKVMPT